MATTNTKPSGKLITEWSNSIHVGIWDNCATSIRLYADRAIYKAPYVKWRNNSGSLDVETRRITGDDLKALLQIAKEEDEDGEDYTGQAFQLLSQRY